MKSSDAKASKFSQALMCRFSNPTLMALNRFKRNILSAIKYIC